MSTVQPFIAELGKEILRDIICNIDRLHRSKEIIYPFKQKMEWLFGLRDDLPEDMYDCLPRICSDREIICNEGNCDGYPDCPFCFADHFICVLLGNKELDPAFYKDTLRFEKFVYVLSNSSLAKHYYQKKPELFMGMSVFHNLIANECFTRTEACEMMKQCEKGPCASCIASFCLRKDVPVKDVFEIIYNAEADDGYDAGDGDDDDEDGQPMDFRFILSHKSNLTMDDILAHPDIIWCWQSILLFNDVITLDQVLSHPGLREHLTKPSELRSLTLQDVKNHPELDWTWLFEPVTKEFYDENPHIKYLYYGLCKKDWFDVEHIVPFLENTDHEYEMFVSSRHATWGLLYNFTPREIIFVVPEFLRNPASIRLNHHRTKKRKEWMRPFLLSAISSGFCIFNDLALLIADFM